MRVLMLGWEFPPFISGGLGTACQGLTRAMNRLRVNVLFVLPKAEGTLSNRARISPTVDPAAAGSWGQGGVRSRRAAATLPNPYASMGPRSGVRGARPLVAPAAAVDLATEGEGTLRVVGAGAEGGYSGDMAAKIEAYADACLELVKDEPFDIIHAHDWMTYPAAEAIALKYHKPYVLHVHATEFDRAGTSGHPAVSRVEGGTLRRCTRAITVSALTKNIIVDNYGIPEPKVDVVHNGIEIEGEMEPIATLDRHPKTVLFLGRITMQKGPEYFVEMARRVCEQRSDVKFVVVGWGDLGPRMIEHVAGTGLAGRVLFTGFLRGQAVASAFRAADVYVMPSVSEPFGLTPLEALRHGTPVIVSKRSGVAEVLSWGSLQADFWDIDKMADYVLAVLRYPELSSLLVEQGQAETRELTWDLAAQKCVAVYEKVLGPQTLPTPAKQAAATAKNPSGTKPPPPVA